MRVERANNTNFQGKLVITNHLSNKPKNCINKVRGSIENLIQKKDYNLYVTQDYSKNEICMTAKYPAPMLNKTGICVPINAKASKYVDTAKKTINDFETGLKQQKEKQWEKEANKQEFEEIGKLIGAMVFLPLFMIIGGAVELYQDLNKSTKNMFNKAKKLAIKKG